MAQGHIEKPGKGLYQISLAGTGGPDHEHVGFFNLDIIHRVGLHPFVVVVDRHGNDLLGIFLADHIIVQLCLDLRGAGMDFTSKAFFGPSSFFFFLIFCRSGIC